MAARSTLTVVSGSTITSAWGNSVRDHAVPRTTSDDVSAEGMLAANTSTNEIVVHDGSSARTLVAYGAWESYIGLAGIAQGTGGVTGLGAGSVAEFTMIGRTVHWSYEVEVASVLAPQAGAAILIGFPVAARSIYGRRGNGYFFDVSTGMYYPCVVHGGGSTSGALVSSAADGTSITLGATGSPFASAIDVGDWIRVGGTYQAAS